MKKHHHHTTPGGDNFLLTVSPADWSRRNRRRDRISDFLTASAGALGLIAFLFILIFLSR